MATLVLGALGTLVGGPIGGAIGATLGRNLDAMVIGTPRRHGPRLKELSISTSSYGQPIPALYGAVRAPGTVIWSTDLQERSETSGGGKGKPKTTTYSYSVSLAVALSSRPIDGLGRIWADGNLLRGAAGDLKTGGIVRTYTGRGDQMPDPLMAAAIGAQCPAYRGCAYIVFEDLALEDFGNRIPALSFEVHAGSAVNLVETVTRRRGLASASASFPELDGFVHEGGSEANLLALVDHLRPIGAVSKGGQLAVESIGGEPEAIPTLPPPAAWDEGEFGVASGQASMRRAQTDRSLGALRYYDRARDYQPGLQRTSGEEEGGAGPMLEFPGVFGANEALGLLARAVRREKVGGETLAWRTTQLDPEIGPGRIVRVPDVAGLWRVASWEWRERGVELELVRYVPQIAGPEAADAGAPWVPADRAGVETSLRVFELPWDGRGSSSEVQRFAAIGAQAGRWSGATLYDSTGATLAPLASSDGQRALVGTVLDPISPSNGNRFEPQASLRVRLEDQTALLETVGVDDLARGANRLLVGSEILQFAHASPQGSGDWKLTGLLRGRGGSEGEALAGHAPGTPVTLLDERLLELPLTASGSEFAAIGLSDTAPVGATLESEGRTRRPLVPVHGQCSRDAEGVVILRWVRRARGGWDWLDEVEQPLVEQHERYEVGFGALEAPAALWQIETNALVLDAATIAALPEGRFWVRQCGDFAKSGVLDLGPIPQIEGSQAA